MLFVGKWLIPGSVQEEAKGSEDEGMKLKSDVMLSSLLCWSHGGRGVWAVVDSPREQRAGRCADWCRTARTELGLLAKLELDLELGLGHFSSTLCLRTQCNMGNDVYWCGVVLWYGNVPQSSE